MIYWNRAPVDNMRSPRGRILVALTLGIYLQSGGFEFLHYDDDVYLTKNPRVSGGIILENFQWALGARTGNLWHPLTLWSHQICSGLFGLNPSGHHLVNLALHLATIGLVARWLLGHGARGWPLVLAVAVWALHPHRVEVVSWVSARKDLLATPACILCLILIGGENRSYLRLGLAALVLICALGAKPSIVVFPCLLLIDQLMRKRWREVGWRGLAVPLVFSGLAAGIVAGITVWFQQSGGHQAAFDHWPSTESVMRPILMLQEAIRTTLLPFPTEAMRPVPDPMPWSGVLWALAPVALLTMAAIAGIRRGNTLRLIGLGWFWFLLCLLPVSGIVPVGTTYFADRYTYLAHLGLLPGVAAWLRVATMGNRARLAIGILTLLVLTMAAGSFLRCREWRDDLTLFGAEVARNPDNPATRVNLANALGRAHRDGEAEVHYREALGLEPDDYKALHNLGALLARGEDQTRQSEAIGLLTRALDSPEARERTPLLLTRLLIQSQRPDEAGAVLARSLGRFPRSAPLHDLQASGTRPGAKPRKPPNSTAGPPTSIRKTPSINATFGPWSRSNEGDGPSSRAPELTWFQLDCCENRRFLRLHGGRNDFSGPSRQSPQKRAGCLDSSLGCGHISQGQSHTSLSAVVVVLLLSPGTAVTAMSQPCLRKHQCFQQRSQLLLVDAAHTCPQAWGIVEFSPKEIVILIVFMIFIVIFVNELHFPAYSLGPKRASVFLRLPGFPGRNEPGPIHSHFPPGTWILGRPTMTRTPTPWFMSRISPGRTRVASCRPPGVSPLR